MKSKKVLRYFADCGRGFWSKSAALNHENNCKCWTNPNNKTCKTCVHGGFAPYEADTGHGGLWECWNEKNPDHEHSGGPEGVDYISVKCDLWEVRH